MHQQLAIVLYVITERQLGEISAVERDHDPAQKTSEHDTAVALIRRQAVGLSLRVVKLLLPCLHVDVCVSQLAEIDLRARHAQTSHRALNRHIAQNQRGQSFLREPIYWIHGDAVTVRVDQLFINPVATALRKLLDVQLARGKHHLTSHPVDFVAINVNIGKVVVGANFLNLTQSVLKGVPVPQPDILQRSLIMHRVGRRDVCLSGKLALRNSVQSVGLPRQGDIVGDVRLLANELVWFHDEAADVPADHLKADITQRRREDRRGNPAPAWYSHGVDGRDHCAENQRRADD
jgi:hypothetical protein